MPSRRQQTRRRGRVHKFDGLGEGRSKPIYIEPTVSDTCVLLAFYNPVPFKRILKNILYIMKCMKEKKIPCFVTECVFHGAKPQIPGADLVLHSDSYMFYKEQLLNKLEEIVPAKYTKIVCMDGDIMFDTPDWLNQISVKLDTCDVIQPFSEACWLIPDNTRIRSKKPSYAYAIINKRPLLAGYTHAYHPGFVWAFRREKFKEIGGFYPRSIMGNGDMLFTYNFITSSIPEGWKREFLKKTFILDAWNEYHMGFKAAKLRLGYINMKALHLFHGLQIQRQYRTRYKDASEYLPDKWDDSIFVNKDGLYEFQNPDASKAVLKYFKGRNEDIPLEQAMRATTYRRGKNEVPRVPTAPGGVNLNGAEGPELNIPQV